MKDEILNKNEIFDRISSTSSLISKIEKKQPSIRRKLYIKNLIKKIKIFFKEKLKWR